MIRSPSGESFLSVQTTTILTVYRAANLTLNNIAHGKFCQGKLNMLLLTSI